MPWIFLAFVLCLVFPLPGVTVKSRPCSGGVEAAKIRMEVRRPEGGDARSLARIKRIEKGSKITYRPIDLPADLKTNARVALVLGSAAENGSTNLTVLEFKPAGISGDWIAPFRPTMAIFVLGPQGLDEKRLTTLVSKDEDLLGALADYADQTDEIEDTVELLTALEESEDAESDDTPRLDRTNPTEQALYTLLRAVNPSLMANNPLGQGKRVGPVTLMNKATVGFFDNAGGIFWGGGALSELKPMLMPDTDFRAAFVQRTGENLALCVPRVATKSRNRQVYVWAHRIIDSAAPALTISTDRRAPLGARAVVAARTAKAADWKYVERFDRWTLAPAAGGEGLPVKLRTTGTGRNLEIDLRGFPGGPGKYALRGDWDWDTVTASGEVELARLGDLKLAKLGTSSQPLLEGAGVTALALEGTDFQFLDRVTIRPFGGQVELAQPVQFLLPKGRRGGVQDRVTLEVDSRLLRGGQHVLALQQADGRTQELPVAVSPSAGRIENLPLRVAGSTGPQRIVLRGQQLDQIARIEVDGGSLQLDPVNGKTNERGATLQFKAAMQRGDKPALRVEYASGAKSQIAGALEVLGNAPRITSARASLPAEMGVALRNGEIPAGVAVTFQVQTDAADAAAMLVTCGAVTRRVAAGERLAEASVTAQSAGVYLLTMRANGACTLTASVESAEGLVSDAAALGKVVRLPVVEGISFTGERNADGTYAAILTGRDLDTIEKTGWGGGAGAAVTALPEPALQQPERQLLRVSMPWPPPAPRSQVMVWLRGESEGRATAARY